MKFINKSIKALLSIVIIIIITVIIIQNKDDFIKNYDKIFTVEYKQALSKARTRDLDATYQGIMVGNGLIWINDKTLAGDESSKLMIIAINN